MRELVIATRKSRLALWQSEHVADALRRAVPGLEVRLLPLSTRGDEILDRSLAEIGGKGLFLKELEKALYDERADIAVHSLKDVPADQPEGLALGAYLARANPLDLWIGRDGLSVDELPAGSRVGSSSLRRISQLRARRADLEPVPLRGNVETRLAAVGEGRVDATILAAAGLERLDMVPDGAVAMNAAEWLPAPGQGIIVVQQRAGDARVAGPVAQLACDRTTVQAIAEREVVRALGGDCTMPLAAHAFVDGDEIRLAARLGGEDGTLIDAEVDGRVADARSLGARAADRLLERGGRELLDRLNVSRD
jgi:hydroxymethylbilane synthase